MTIPDMTHARARVRATQMIQTRNHILLYEITYSICKCNVDGMSKQPVRYGFKSNTETKMEMCDGNDESDNKNRSEHQNSQRPRVPQTISFMDLKC